jgi:hypothetical protein
VPGAAAALRETTLIPVLTDPERIAAMSATQVRLTPRDTLIHRP